MKVLVLYAHPAQQHSKANARMAEMARATKGISFVDLYAKYPRLNLDVEAEQQRLLDHDAIILQFPLMWYSTPPILKLWQDLVLEYGFAYGPNGDRVKGKLWLASITAGAPEAAYGSEGHNRFSLREMLTPLEATANLCAMPYIAPYTLFASLEAAQSDRLDAHVEGYRALLEGLRDDRFNIEAARGKELMFASEISSLIKGDKS